MREGQKRTPARLRHRVVRVLEVAAAAVLRGLRTGGIAVAPVAAAAAAAVDVAFAVDAAAAAAAAAAVAAAELLLSSHGVVCLFRGETLMMRADYRSIHHDTTH